MYRYGHLPKDLPSWFNSLDEDKDGQVGLYEWRKGGKATTEYLTMDLNQDGLLTAEEYLKFKKDGSGGGRSTSAARPHAGCSASRRAKRTAGSRPRRTTTARPCCSKACATCRRPSAT